MTVSHVEFLVEEPSAEAALRELLPGVLGDVSFAIHAHSGKDDLLRKLPAKLKGYAAWLPEDHRIVVLVDCDDDNCRKLKARLEKYAREAGLKTRSTRPKTFTVVNRIAVEELEAWFFGDWEAVRAAYPRVKATIPAQAPYRKSDEIQGGTWEALERVLQKAGYFSNGLPKIEVARAVAQHMKPKKNTSPSFGVFHSALLEFVAP